MLVSGVGEGELAAHRCCAKCHATGRGPGASYRNRGEAALSSDLAPEVSAPKPIRPGSLFIDGTVVRLYPGDARAGNPRLEQARRTLIAPNSRAVTQSLKVSLVIAFDRDTLRQVAIGVTNGVASRIQKGFASSLQRWKDERRLSANALRPRHRFMTDRSDPRLLQAGSPIWFGKWPATTVWPWAPTMNVSGNRRTDGTGRAAALIREHQVTVDKPLWSSREGKKKTKEGPKRTGISSRPSDAVHITDISLRSNRKMKAVANPASTKGRLASDGQETSAALRRTRLSRSQAWCAPPAPRAKVSGRQREALKGGMRGM